MTMKPVLLSRPCSFMLACIAAPIAFAQPVNDECSGAITLPVGPTDCSWDYLDVSTSGATDSNMPLPCDPTTVGYQDIWYTFNAGDNTEVYIYLYAVSGVDFSFGIYDACGGNLLGCAVFPQTTVTVPVTANTTYYMRIWSNLQYGLAGEMGLCLSANDPEPPPANNSCNNAASLVMGTSCTPINGTIALATSSDFVGMSDCGDFLFYDVWYEFVATGTTVNIEVDPEALFDASVRLTTSCGANALACANAQGPGGAESIAFSGLNLGSTYRVQVANTGVISTPQTAGFTICVWGAPPPVNNNCSGAIALPMTAACTPVNGTTSGATSSAPTNGCGNGNQEQDDDVWYSVTATSGDLLLTVDGDGNGTTGFDPVVELLYANNCNGNFNQIACADNTGPGATEEISFSGVSVGLTYYVLVYDAGTDAPGTSTFTICAQDLNTTGITSTHGVGAWSISVDAASDHLLMNYHGAPTEHGTLELMDMTGRTLRRWTTSLRDGDRRALDLADTAPGQYILGLDVQGERSAQRVILDR